ncbi:MAG: peptidoglycan DD-metalloendopeptidase family protein [Alphaproteobacteria bacterium]
MRTSAGGLCLLAPVLLLSGCLEWSRPKFPGGRPDKEYAVTVREGDTYWSIARRLNLSVEELIDLNRADPPYRLYPGDRLLLPEPSVHIVRDNETLITIARRYGVDHQRLARRNGIENPGQVRPGVKLRIPDSRTPAALPSGRPRSARDTGSRPKAWWGRDDDDERPPGRAGSKKRILVAPTPPKSVKVASRPAQPPVPKGAPRLDWPVRGRIVSGYGSKGKGAFNDGINIAVRAGTPVRAAAGGIVIYRGNLVPGFGRLVLVKHDKEIVTAYAHLDSYAVGEGQTVRRGQMIGRAGSSGSVDEPQLHFEVRRGVRAVDPGPYMTTRRS